MSHTLWAIPTSFMDALIPNPPKMRIASITEFYLSDNGTQCAVVLFANGEFDQIPTREIEVR